MVRKIALEEHFLCPGFEDYWYPTVADVSPEARAILLRKLCDFGDERLGAMDGAGIERSILSLSGPGVQVEKDKALAIANARKANDFLAEKVAARPDRLQRLRASRVAGRPRCGRRTRSMREHVRLQGRADQRQHARHLSGRSDARTLVGARAASRCAALSSPRRPGLHHAGARWPQGTEAGRRGNGRSRPAHMRCGSCSAVSSTNIRAQLSFSAISVKPCPICSGASTAAPSSTA